MKKTNVKAVLHYQVPPRIIYSLIIFCLCIISCILFLFNTEAISLSCGVSAYLFAMHSDYRIISFFTLAICFGFIYCILGKLLLSYVVMEIITICWGIANKIVLMSREQFITKEELGVFKDAVGVGVDFGLIYHPFILVLVLLGIVNGLLLWWFIKALKKECKNIKKCRYRWIIRGVSVILLGCIFVLIYIKPEETAMDDVLAYRKSGCVVWFCQSLFGNATKVISADMVEEIYSAFQNEVPEKEVSDKRPNVIVIMSEAFWDINNLENVVYLSENPMDKYNELTQNAITGQVAVNVYGGGTNNPEFEFLTGINARYLKNANYYGAYYAFKQQSLVTYMNQLGYYSMVLHPYNAEFYDRGIGYSNMGFEEFITDDKFKNREMCHGYISDKSLTKEIIDLMEEQKMINPEQPIFTFAISIQNHVHNMRDYDHESQKEGLSGITVEVKDSEAAEKYLEDMEEYYNGLNESVEALEELLEYFENFEEDTMIIFFGDHAPGFVTQICDTKGRETEMSIYRTPYMIWTNYENDYESYGDFDLSYLSSVMIDYLNLPKPNQYYMNMYFLKHYPINTRFEQVRLESLNEQRLLDMMSVVSTINKRFPEEEMALPFWSLVE